MAVRTRKRRPVNPSNPNLGKAPTNSQKLIYIAQKLGLPGIAGMQGTTFNLFDTVKVPTSATPQTVEFFGNTANKSTNFSNFQNGALKAGEAMVMERVSFFVVALTTTDLNSNANTITSVSPLSGLIPAVEFTTPGAMQLAQMSISIANQTVLKNFNIFETNPNFNPKTTGIAVTGYTAAASAVIGPIGANDIPLESPPVLPPNQGFTVKLQIPPVGTASATTFIMCVVGRFGCIFASKTTL